MEQLQDKIKAYVKNQMIGTELADFEALLAQDVDLQKEVQVFRDAHFVFQNEKLLATNVWVRQLRDTTPIEPDMDFDMDAFLKESNATDENTPNEPEQVQGETPSNKLWQKGLGFALIGVLSIGLYVLYKNNQTEIALKNIAAPYISAQIEVYKNTFNLQDSSLLDMAMTRYDAHKYAEAIPFFEQHLQKRQNVESDAIKRDYHTHLYLGISYLMSNDMNKAEPHLKIVVQGKNTFLIPPAKYYSALTLMAMGKVDSVHSYLSQVQDEVFSGNNAVEILQKLDKEDIQ